MTEHKRKTRCEEAKDFFSNLPPTQALSVFAYGYTVLSFLFFYRKSTLEFINLISVCNFTGLFFFGLDSLSRAHSDSGVRM